MSASKTRSVVRSVEGCLAAWLLLLTRVARVEGQRRVAKGQKICTNTARYWYLLVGRGDKPRRFFSVFCAFGSEYYAFEAESTAVVTWGGGLTGSDTATVTTTGPSENGPVVLSC